MELTLNEQPKFREGFVEAEDESKKPTPPSPAKAKPAAIAPPVEHDVQEQEAAETWPLKVKLLKPIHLSGTSEIVHEVTFREPTGRDINRHGNPTRMGPEFMFVIDEKKMMLMMTALSGIMTPDLERMDARDWNTCAWRLYRFFLPTTITE